LNSTKFSMTIKLSIPRLKILSVVYLAFPYIIFFMGWLKQPIALALTVVLLYGLFIYQKNQAQKTIIEIPLLQLALIAGITLIWMLFSGAGGFGYQNHDYYKHNYLQYDLFLQKWPISYQVADQTKYLSHYLAYYLPGPAIFASLGWKYVQLANFIFTFSGVLLAVFWLMKFLGRFSYLALILFIFCSGLHIFILIYDHGFNLWPVMAEKIKNHGFVFWTNSLGILPLNFMGNSDMLYWGPQHAIATWLAIGLLINDWLLDNNLKYSPFYISLIAFWAPLVLIGLAPFLLVALISIRFKGIFNELNLIIAPIVFGVIALFLTSIETGDLLQHFIFQSKPIQSASYLSQALTYLYFITVEVLIWWAPSYLILKNHVSKQYKALFITALVVLFFTPLFRYGLYNDWCSRVSLPALFVVFSMAIMAIFISKSTPQKVLLSSLFAAASIGPIILIAGSIRYSHYKISWQPPVEKQMRNLPATDFPIEQFVASPDEPFFKYFAKQNVKK
jgi:hypothetical protein